MVNFRVSDYFRKHQSRLSGPTHAMRTGYDEEIDENDETGWRGVIDCRHLSALQYGRQAVSQFGHGKYTVKIHIWPEEGLTGLLQDRSETTLGMIKCSYVMPTKARYAALHHLKSLEKNNNMVVASSDTFDGETHPLLIANLDTNDPMSPGSGDGAINSGGKGSKVIRFGYDANTYVYGQDSFMADIRGVLPGSDPDGDYNDAHETKYYNLLSDSDVMFGILPRYEASINPTLDEDGNTQVNVEWDMPLNKYKAFGETSQVQPVGYQLNKWIATDPSDDLVADVSASSAYIYTATFSNVEALGGLIKISIPSLLSVGHWTEPENNDFRIWATVTEHSWTPMKR